VRGKIDDRNLFSNPQCCSDGIEQQEAPPRHSYLQRFHLIDVKWGRIARTRRWLGRTAKMFFNGVDARFGETNLPAVTA
jgi:hypothetical protein